LLYLLNKDVRTVRWNGEPLHEATSAIVKETMNGDFTLTVKYPISDSGIYQLIQEDMLIKAPTPVLGAQLFRIKKPVEHNDHLEITAYHISDDVMQRSITPMSVTSQSCGMALSRMVQNTKTALGDFSFNSDIQDRRTFNTTETETLYSVLLDGKHSIVGTWEGELVRDNFALTVKKSRGENRGVVITTHKNLKDYQRTRNSQNVVTRIHAKSTFKPEGAEKETTIRVTVDSPLINSYPYINEKEYENNNAKTVEELQKWAQSKFTNQGIDKVSDAIKIEAYELDGQVVHMGDTVNLKSWKHNVDAFKKAIAYEFDALKEEYISLTFDDKAGTGGSRASGGLSRAADAILGVTESAQEIALEKALQNADLGFDHQAGLLRQEIADGIELARAKAEEVKQELSDTIDQRFSSFDNGPLQEIKRKAIEALQNAGASSLLAQEAKRIGLDSVARLEEFRRQTFNTQSALSGAIDALKLTVNSEVNQASEYRRTTTEALSRMTGQMEGFATKSEVNQGINGLTQTFAKMRVGGTNLLKGSKGPFMPDRKPANFDNNILYVGNTSIYMEQGQEYIISAKTDGNFTAHHDGNKESDNVVLWIMDKDIRNYQIVSDLKTGITGTKIIWNKPSGIYHLRVNTYHKEAVKSVWNVKIEKGNIATDWSPAIEDTDGLITEAKATFEQTAQGLRTDLSAIQVYVNKDGQRQEALQRYTREESAKQATAVRELVARDYVGKSTYQEDARAIERKFEGITNPQNGSIATQIATYKNAVDGRFASITSLLSGKANQVDFQRVQETSRLYERILGNTNNSIVDNVARMALTNQLFQVEVGKYSVSGPNLVKNSDFKNGTKEWASTENLGRLVKHGFYRNGQKDLMRLSNATKNENFLYSARFELERNTDYVLNFRGFNNSNLVSYDVFILGRRAGENNGFTIIKQVVSGKKLSTTGCEDVSVTFNSGEMDNAFIRFDNNGASSGTADLYITEIDLYKGYKPRAWQPAPEDAVADANAKLEATQTKMTQLAGSWSVQNINSAGDLISGINLGADGRSRLIGKSFHITGETLIDDAVIKSAMVGKLKTANFEAGSVTTVVLDAEAVTAEKIKVDQALFNKLVANEAYLTQLFAKQAFINRVQSVAIDASQVRSGILSGDRIYGGTIRGASIYGGTLTGHTQIQLGSYGSFDTVNGGLQINVPRTVNAKDGLGVQFIGSYGRGENVPYGLFIYKDSDFTVGGTAETSDDFLLTVEGYINAKGIGWLRTGKGSVNGKTTGTIGLWNSDNVSLSFGGSGNDIYYSHNGKAYSLWSVVDQHFSDRRLKENIVDCKHKALDYIQQFQFKEYDWKKQDDRPQQAHTKIGLIAQEVQDVDPTLVYENGDTLNLDNLRLTNIALKAIQELALENIKLTHRLENLENEYRTA
jgi:phage minor structural protein